MLQVAISFVSVLLSLVHTTKAGCQIDIQKLPERHPLYLSISTRKIIYPEIGNSIIYLRTGEQFEMECPGSGHIQFGNNTTGEILLTTCLSGWEVEIYERSYNVSSIVCTKRITSVAKYTGRHCSGSHREIEIGFQIQDGRFLHEMTICFDDAEKNVVYSHFVLTKQIGSQTTGNSRPGWTENNFYNLGVKLDTLYKNAVQRSSINRQLGLPDEDMKYVKDTGHYYLAKGHLTAKADFKYNAEQQATFHYVNSVPQWQTFNGYNWFYFEKNLRGYASNNMVDLIVYTGPYGVSTLPHEATGQEVPLYFFSEDHKLMSIPELFWKIAYDPVNAAGVAVLGINNPYQANITKSIICNDIADQLSWLTFDRFKHQAGYIYACTIDDLRSKIPYIPPLRVNHILN